MIAEQQHLGIFLQQNCKNDDACNLRPFWILVNWSESLDVIVAQFFA